MTTQKVLSLTKTTWKTAAAYAFIPSRIVQWYPNAHMNFALNVFWFGRVCRQSFIRERMVKVSLIYLKNNLAAAHYVHKPLESIWYTLSDRGTTIESIFYLPYGHHHYLLVQPKRMPFCEPPARDDDESENGELERVSQTRLINWKGQLLNEGGFIDMISMPKYVLILLCSSVLFAHAYCMPSDFKARCI